MDDRQQQRLNEAAEQFSNALVDSFKTLSKRGEAVQEHNAKLTEDFFNRVIANLRAQAEDNREMSRQLADQQQRAREAGQSLTQESTNAYMDFVNSMFSYWQSGIRTAERGARDTQRTTAETPTVPERDASEAQRTSTEAPPERQAGVELPLEGYDSLNIQQISERLDDLSAEEIRQLRAYEADNKNRSTLLQRLDERIEAGSPS